MKKKDIKILINIGLVISICLVLFFLFGLVLEMEKYGYSQGILYEQVPINVESLPMEPNEKDWYLIAIDVLDQVGWGLDLNVTQLGTTVTYSTNVSMDTVSIDFADAYFKGLVPYIRYASLYLDRSTARAFVSIDEYSFKWKHAVVDLDKSKIDFYRAFEIAKLNGIQDFIEDKNGPFIVNIYISNDGWDVGIREYIKRWPDWKIRIDPITGEAKRVEGYK